MKPTLAILTLALTPLGCASVSTAGPATADVMLDWNAAVLELAEQEDGFLTLKGVRTAALLHIAAHDSLSAITGAYEPYAHTADAKHADPVAAVNAAAYAVVSNAYPDARERLNTLHTRWQGSVPNDASRRAAVTLGRAAAARIIELRQHDAWNSEAAYSWHPMAPGVYAEFNEHSGTPEGFIFGAGWGKARGFALEKPDQFRSPPPPAIDSNAYTRAFNEVKRVGRFQSMERTPDQTHLALWWKDFAENSHNRLARDLIEKEQLSLTDATRLLALVNMAVFDAYVASFDNKFFYNHWRPYTAIRWAEHDGNADTQPEETWTNLHNHTYAFPSYPSAHGTACAAAMAPFIDVFGNDYAFTMRIPQVDLAGPFSGKIDMAPPTRQFASFSDAAMECALSRVYLGIHFRYDSTAGNKLGRQVGARLVETRLQRR